VLCAEAVKSARDGTEVAVAGLVTHRQRPPTARGVVFLSLEDETGMVNVICPPQVWERHQRMATVAPALLVQGRIERSGGAVNLVAGALRPLRVAAAVASRDFRLPFHLADADFTSRTPTRLVSSAFMRPILSAHAPGPELHADPRADMLGCLGDGVLPGALAAAAHD
jgi:DNA polymerase III alpha subunit